MTQNLIVTGVIRSTTDQEKVLVSPSPESEIHLEVSQSDVDNIEHLEGFSRLHIRPGAKVSLHATAEALRDFGEAVALLSRGGSIIISPPHSTTPPPKGHGPIVTEPPPDPKTH